MIFKGDFGLYNKPATQKVYTTEEIALLIGCPSYQVRNITSYYNIECEKVIRDKSRKVLVYTYDAVKLIKERYEARHDKQKQKSLMSRTPEEAAALEDHSLVTDKRCLDFNYWPDIVPNCFKEIDA